MEYDSKVIIEFAAKLYEKARSIIIKYTVIGALAGGIIGMTSTHQELVALILAAIVGFIGYSLGSDKAFQLKLQAQQALCQVQIEKNSRAS